MRRIRLGLTAVLTAGLVVLLAAPGADLLAQGKKKKAAEKKKELPFPPKLPGEKEVVTDTSDDFLKPTAKLRDGVAIAKTPPTIDFAYFPGQDYPGRPWSAWGDSTFANGKYYTSFGDHLAPAGNGFIYEYDPATKKFRLLCDIKKVLNLPEGRYVPGKVHTQLTLGSDGWLYFATHRGSTKAPSQDPRFEGDWIIRCHPETGKSEVVAVGPVPKHSIPTGFLDPKRLIFYGSTAPNGNEAEGIHFFAYDVKNRKVLCDVPNGPSRAMIFSKSTGRVWYEQGKGERKGEASQLVRWDPAKGGEPVKIPGDIGLRASSDESADGIVYTVSQPPSGEDAQIYAFDTKTEKIEKLGPANVGGRTYITSLDIDPTGHYLYYIAGAHGGAEADGSPVVQYDVKTKTRKVIAFLHPFYKDKYGVTPSGTYSAALSDKGDRLFVTWNANRGGRVWDTVALSVVHIPESERKP